MNELLHDELGFTGFTVCDTVAARNLANQDYAADLAHALGLAPEAPGAIVELRLDDTAARTLGDPITITPATAVAS